MFIKSDKGIDQSGKFELFGIKYKLNNNPKIDKSGKIDKNGFYIKNDDFNYKNFKFARFIKINKKYYYCHIYKINNIYRIARIYSFYKIK
jgi:hypothetical protein